jgi:hypothetical protein
MDKKAQGLSMNVIIIAAISLLVLIVLIVLVLRASNNMGSGTSCQGVGGQCVSDDGSGQPCAYLETEAGVSWNHNMAKDGKQGGCSEGYICCVRTENNPIQ